MNFKKNVIANYLGRFYTILIGIVVLPIYLKYLGAESYGLVGFFTMLMSWIMLLDMGFSQVLSREAARLRDKKEGLLELKMELRGVESMILIVSILVATIIFLSSDFIASNWLHIKDLPLDVVENVIKLMAFIMILRWYVSLYNSLVLGFEEQVWLNIYKASIATFRFIGGLILVIYITDNIFYYFIYQAFIAFIEFYLLNRKVYGYLPKNRNILMPSIASIKKIAPFALGVAYTSGVWVVFSQLDKLLLSHYISLDKYGYFSLVVLVSNAIMQFSYPLSQAILPRMTSLLSNNKENEMLALYRRGTHFISIVVFSVVGIVAFFSYELLYSWTGDSVAASWASPILFWYALGNAILAILGFPYYLQYAYGNLKYHMKFNTYFSLLALPILFFAINSYGALGAGVAWFFIHLTSFLIWPTFVHNKFGKGIHRDWLLKDILTPLILTIIYLSILKFIDIDFSTYSRFETFIILVALGIGLLFLNMLTFSEFRKRLKKILNFQGKKL
jgi:O-antigen/teichoic acid export membrane protein